MTTKLDVFGRDKNYEKRKLDAILNTCTVLNKRARQFDEDIKIGAREQIANFKSYLDAGSSTEDIVFFTMTQKATELDMIQRYENADPKFAKKIKGRLLVIDRINSIINPVMH